MQERIEFGAIVKPDHDRQAEILLTLIKEYNISNQIAHDEIKFALIRAQHSGEHIGYRKAMDEYARGC